MPNTLLPLALRVPNLFPHHPILQSIILNSRRGPDSFPRVFLLLSSKPSRPMRSSPPFLPSFPRNPLKVFLLILQIISMLIPPQLKRPLIRSQPAIRRTQIRLQYLLRTIIQRDRERRQVERRFGFLRISPEEDIFRGRNWGR